MRRLGVGLLATLAAVLGCGGGHGGSNADGSTTSDGGSTASCTITQSGADAFTVACSEGTGSYADQIRQTCFSLPSDAAAAPHTQLANGPCSRANAVGGCMTSLASGTLTSWFYATSGLTSDAIAALCAQAGQTFVPP